MFISSELSGTYEGAVRAARAVKARNIGFSYALVDSSSCGYDEAWPVFDAVEARDAGGRFGRVRGRRRRRRGAHALPVHAGEPDLPAERRAHRQRGGPSGQPRAARPVLTVIDGKATTFAKVRTRKKALERIAEAFLADVESTGCAARRCTT